MMQKISNRPKILLTFSSRQPRSRNSKSKDEPKQIKQSQKKNLQTYRQNINNNTVELFHNYSIIPLTCEYRVQIQ